MNTLYYMSAAGLCLAATWLASALLLRKGTDFRIQRLFIIVAVILSLVLPLSRFSIELPHRSTTTSELPMAKVLASSDNVAEGIDPEKPGFLATTADSLERLYYIIIAVWLSALLIQFAKILFLYTVSERQRRGTVTVLTGSRIKTPFSFFRMIYIPGDIDVEAERESIIIHESIHASQYHSFDNLLIELLTAVMWFNPFVWMIRRSLHLVHEYLADEGTLGAGVDRIRYQALLINQVAEERLICLSSDFNNKLLKKRMIMMTNSNQKKEGTGKLTAILPLVIVMFLTVSVLNGFFARDTKASGQGSLAIAMAEPVTFIQTLQVQQDTPRMDKVKVTGYAEKNPQIRVEKRTPAQDASGSSDIKVIGYGAQKTEPGQTQWRIRRADSDTTAPKPVIVVDGLYMENMDDLDPNQISTVNVIKEDNLIIVRTKSFEGSKSDDDKVMIVTESSSDNILYFIDGKKTDKKDFEKIDPSEIKNIAVFKDKESVKIYTNEDVDGVMVIETKK